MSYQDGPSKVPHRLGGAAASEPLPPLYGSRLLEGDPWAELLAIPGAFLLALLFSAPSLGRLLTSLVRIQFHELGHALPAWLSSRAALPLPFGITFFNEQQSVFTGLCMLFLLGLFTQRALREGRRTGAALGGLLLVAFVVLSLFVSASRSRVYVLAGGFVGELALPTLALVAFYFRLPDRLRWDFFRFVTLVPSAAAWLDAARSWRAIAAGREGLPMSSLLLGDGSSDFARLMEEYDLTSVSIVRLGTGMVHLTAVVLVVAYALYARAAIGRLRARRDHGS